MEISNTPSYRYPGAKPFEPQDHEIFKGRDEDIKNLCEKVQLQNMIVLYGRSGLGKSSLLNAGLLNKLKAEGRIAPVTVRLGAAGQAVQETPLQKLQNAIADQYPAEKTSFLYQKLIKDVSITSHFLWYHFKNIQIIEPQRTAFVLIFDQFEELFTYPAEEITKFKKELSNLFFVSVPQQLRNIITDKLDEDAQTGLEDNEFNLLYKPLHIKILFSIRSDKLSMLQSLATDFPSILQNYYELKPLTIVQARQSIQAPAALTNSNFLASPFTFKEDATQLIINELSSSQKASGWQSSEDIETIQLQIVCKYAENIVIEKKLEEISTADLGNIKNILENYYRNFINSLPAEERLPARKLLEEKLIIDGVRVSMPIAFILKEPGMTRELLDKLIKVHIIRPEQNETVEISHDTLIGPVTRFYNERQREEFIQNELKKKELEIQKIKDAREKELAEQLERQKKTRRRNIRITIVTALTFFCGIAFWGWRQSLGEAHKAKAFMSTIIAENTLDKDPTLALSMAYEAVNLYPDTFIVNKAVHILSQNRFYKNVFHAAPHNFLSISKYGNRFLTSSDEGKDSVWDISGKLLYTFTQSGTHVRSVDFSKDGNKLLMGCFDGSVVLHDHLTGTESTIAHESSRITTALFSPDESAILWRVEEPGLLKIKKLTGNAPLKVYGEGFIICAVFSPDGTRVLTGSKDNIARLWSLSDDTNQKFQTWGGDIMSVSFLTSSKKFLVGSWGGIASYFDLALGNTVSAVLLNSDVVCALAYESDSILYTGTFNGNITCWKGPISNQNGISGCPYDFEKINELKGHNNHIRNIVFDSASNVIVSCSNDGTVKKWAPPLAANSIGCSNEDKIKALKKFVKQGNVAPLTLAQKQQLTIH